MYRRGGGHTHTFSPLARLHILKRMLVAAVWWYIRHGGRRKHSHICVCCSLQTESSILFSYTTSTFPVSYTGLYTQYCLRFVSLRESASFTFCNMIFYPSFEAERTSLSSSSYCLSASFRVDTYVSRRVGVIINLLQFNRLRLGQKVRGHRPPGGSRCYPPQYSLQSRHRHFLPR